MYVTEDLLFAQLRRSIAEAALWVAIAIACVTFLFLEARAGTLSAPITAPYGVYVAPLLVALLMVWCIAKFEAAVGTVRSILDQLVVYRATRDFFEKRGEFERDL